MKLVRYYKYIFFFVYLFNKIRYETLLNFSLLFNKINTFLVLCDMIKYIKIEYEIGFHFKFPTKHLCQLLHVMLINMT